MGVADVTIKELFGSKISKYVYIIIAVILLMWNLPKYIVTVPVFAGAMQDLKQQMWTGDRLQEKNWLQSEIDRLKNKLLSIWDKGRVNLTEVDLKLIDDINSQINCKQKRIDQINYDMEQKWRNK